MFLGASRQTGVHMVARLDIGMDGIRGMSCVIFNIPILALSDRIRIQMEKVATYAVILVHHAHSSTLLENNPFASANAPSPESCSCETKFLLSG